MLIVDDHTLFAEGLAALLGLLGAEIDARRVESCEQALEYVAREGSFDLVLFDLMLPGVNHMDAFRLLESRMPGVPLVAVSGDERPRMIAELLRAGARGYIPKSTNTEIMLGALRLVLSGGTYVPDAMIGPSAGTKTESSLTPRERQVLELLAGGHGNKAIAAQLAMADSTVRVHVTSILRRLGVTSRAEVPTSSSSLSCSSVRSDELVAARPGARRARESWRAGGAPASSSERERTITDECLRLTFEQLGWVTFSTSLVALLLADFLRAHAPTERILRWIVTYHLMLALRAAVVIWYRRRPRSIEELRRILPLHTLVSVAVAGAWACVAFVAPRTDTVALAVELLFAGGLIAGGSQSQIGTPRILMLGAAVTISPLLCLFFSSGDHAQRYLGLVALVYWFSVFQFARRNLRLLRESVALRFGNRELVERLKVEKERVERARDAAELATGAKNQFLAAASHDIRQPLHAAFLFLGALIIDAAASSRNLLDRLRTSLTAARQTLDALLEGSRLDAGVVERTDSVFRAADLGRRVTEMLRPVAERKGVALALRAPETLWIHSDPSLVERILTNLVSNAVKYTESGVVLVAFRRRQNACLVQVWDSGVGIEPEALPTIFDEFKQLGNPERDGSRGIGLGLSIVRRLCTLLGSEVAVRSTPGKGSVFSFTLPTAPRGEASQQVRARRERARPRGTASVVGRAETHGKRGA